MTDLTNPIFTDEDKARAHLEALRWPDGPVCPHCGSTGGDVAAVKSTGKQTKAPKKGKHRPARKGLYYCNACGEQFTVQVGTVLEKSHIPLNKWIAGFYLMCSSKKGVSAHQLHRTLAVSYKSAWFMAHRIREAMRVGGLMPPMGSGGGTVEADETYISTSAEGRALRTKGVKSLGRGGAYKRTVLTLVERHGEARSFHIDRASIRTVLPTVEGNLDKEALIATDDAPYYRPLTRRGRRHESVNHSDHEYARGLIHTNTVEGYFSIFKRGMKGVYQHCSEKHLHRYLAEFDFRYSNRVKLGIDDTERTVRAIRGAEGKRLTYRRTNGA
jgi:transposase-like protein